MDFPQPTPASPKRRTLWLIGGGIGGLIVFCCCCVGVLLVGNMGGGAVTSLDETGPLPQATRTPSKNPALEGAQAELPIAAVSGEALKNFGAEMGQIEPGIEALVNWANAQGYLPPEGDRQLDAVRANHPGGDEIRAFAVASKTDPHDSIAFVQVVSVQPDGALDGRSLAARMTGSAENPVLVLFDQDGQVEISAKQFQFSSNLAPLAAVQRVQYGALFQNPADPAAPACTTTGWDEYQACFISSNNNSIFSWGVSCPTALAAAYAAWMGGAADPSANLSTLLRAGATVAALNACGTAALTCLDDSIDNAPTVAVLSEPKPIESVWKSCSSDRLLSLQNRFQVALQWSDDRLPFEYEGKQVYEFAPGYKGSIFVSDCGGNRAAYAVSTGAPTYVDSHPCGDNEICREDGKGNASCELTSANPQPNPSGPDQAITRRGEISDVSVGVILENYLEFHYNSNGGPVTGSGRLHTTRVEENWAYCPPWDTSATFSFEGSYLSETRHLNGYYQSSVTSTMYGGTDCSSDTQTGELAGTFEATENADGTFSGVLYTNGAADVHFTLYAP